MVMAFDSLKAMRAVFVSIRDQADRAIADIDATATVPTTAEMQDFLTQMMNVGPSVIAAVTPVKDAETI